MEKERHGLLQCFHRSWQCHISWVFIGAYNFEPRHDVPRPFPFPPRNTVAVEMHSNAIDERPVVVPAGDQEVLMKTLRVLDSSGDRAIRFDDSGATAQSRADAQALFERMLAKGAVAFKVSRRGGRPDEMVTQFAALEDETIVVPRLSGG
jgi:hypothetical protein